MDLEETGRFDFEVKCGSVCKSKLIRGFLDQVEAEGKKDNYKVVLVKPDREEAFVVMPFTTFTAMLDELLPQPV